MFDLSKIATPEQLQALSRIREATSKIRATIISKDNFVKIELDSEDEEAKAQIPGVRRAIVDSLATTLHQLFGIGGKILE